MRIYKADEARNRSDEKHIQNQVLRTVNTEPQMKKKLSLPN
uniref:Uncharacterized protein n=1 Tax=Arundo donax TaxID=35708 RepID=A0A0A8YWH9_ARUDO